MSNNPGFSRIPQIAASGNNVYVVWEDGNDILYRRSTDGGITFTDTENLSNSPGSSDGPGIAVLGNNVYVVWKEAVGGNTEILCRSSTDAGTVFEPTSMNLSNKAGFSISPAIAVS